MSTMNLRRAAEMCAQEFTIEYEGGSEKIWVRTRTQLEIEMADRLMADKRLEIKEKYAVGNTAYKSAVIDLDLQSDYTLSELIIGQEQLEVMRKAQRELPSLIPFDGSRYHSEADRQKAEEKFQTLSDQWQRDLDAKVRELTAKRETDLLSRPHDELVEMASRQYIRMAIYSETEVYAQAYMIRDCVRDGEEHSKPYFETIEDVPDSGGVRDYLLNVIRQVDNINPIGDIKNSQGRSVLLSEPAESTPEPMKDRSTTDSPASGSRKENSRGGRKAS